MKKMFSLLRACMSSDMSLFRINNKNKNGKKRGKAFPIIFSIIFMMVMGGYAESLIEQLLPYGGEKSLIVLFGFLIIVLTLVEGIYKAGSLLFNCKDDDLLLSLPIKKSTVLFVRIFKFYVFEVIYNAIFMLPILVVYAIHATVGWTYWLVGITGLLILPIIPIVISCIIGSFSTRTSIKFKKKSLVESAISMTFALAIMFVSFRLQTYMVQLAQNSEIVNQKIYQLYYPMKIFAELLFNFNIVTYVIAVLSNIAIFAITVFVLRNIYFKINSKSKEYSTSSNKDYKIVTRKPVNSLINKEFKKFFSSSVFVTNAAFSLVLFIIGCVAVIIKYDDIINAIVEHTTEATLAAEQIKQYVPLIMGGFIIVSTFMSSITSSMISLEGKKIEILKSLPIKPYTIITSKVLMAVILMLPILLIGTLGVSIRCSFGIIETIILLALCVIMTFVAETFGIIVNLKYPKMDAKNDTEVVKQSTSSMIAVMGGMFIIMINMGIIGMLAYLKLSNILILLIITVFYAIIYTLMKLYINSKGTKLFNKIQV